MTGRKRPFRKVIVVGLDGLEPSLVASLRAAGSLPNLTRLAEAGGLSTVATTSPAQTPVAWSTFATGLNPGGHGVFDFLRRDPATYLPDLALNRYEQKSPFLPPKAVNLRRGVAVWDRLASAGIPATILRCPCTYPAAIERGRLLSGMGVPDLRGGLGTPTFYPSTGDLSPRESESVVPLGPPVDGRIVSHLIGPRNPKDRSSMKLEIVVEPGPDSVTIRSEGTPRELTVRLGEWSDWLRVKFKLGMLQSVRGSVRFHLNRVSPTVELYASPVNFDPEMPLFPISSPAGLAQELTEAIGPFSTTGMVEDHTGLNNERIDEYAFLDGCADAWDEREAMMLHELERLREGLFYCLFDTPDRVQHMFWRFREPDHPANRGRPLPADLAKAIEETYRRADEAVGRALEFADDETLVVVLSDHGFGSFRRGVNVNNWLRDQGLLTLRAGAEHEEFPKSVDWSKTRAYGLGLGGIYLNLRSREAAGIVEPGEADGLARAIAGGLSGLVDPESGGVAIREVRRRDELYRGPFAAESPDLVVHFAAGYRVSWAGSLGGMGAGLFEDNLKKWSGDHIVDPALVPGVLLMNRPFRGEGAGLIDLAPTILKALGAPEEESLEGRSLLA